MKKYSQLAKLMRHQSGVILVYVLVFIAIVALTLPPLLNYVNTDYKSGRVYQEKADDFYTADAGIQDARWQIQNGRLSTIYLSPNIYNQFDFSANPPWHETGLASTEYGVYYPSTTGVYNVSNKAAVNDRNVKVAIKNVWVVSNVNVPDTSTEITQALGIIQTAKLVVVGSDPQGMVDANARKFQVELTYYPASGENLYVTTIGVWLPPGFSYYPVDGTHPFQMNGQTYNPGTPTISQFAGGTSVLWTLPANTLFKNLPGINVSDNPMKVKATFWYRYDKTGQETSTIAQAVGWITTSGVASIPYAWDASTHVLQLSSTSVSSSATKIDSLLIHQDARPIGGAVNGDYYATGGSILGGNTSMHDALYNSTTAVVATTSDPLTGVPSNGTLAAAYLYWSGWIDWNGYNPYGASDITISPPDIENGVSFSASPGPTWTNGSKWSANYSLSSNPVFKVTGTTTGTGDATGTLTSASIDLSAYAGKTVNLYWDQARGATALAATDYLYCQVWTGSAWTTIATVAGNDAKFTTSLVTYGPVTIPSADITASSRMRFCTTLSSTSKIIYLDNIKFVNPALFSDDCSSLAKWTQTGTTWSLASNQFRAVGGGTTANSYLTMANPINLSAYSAISVAIAWSSITDTFTSGDHLYFSFSNDGGSTWSADTECLNSTMANGYASFLIPASPTNYKTAAFKMRYKITAASSSSTVTIDSIAISGPTLEYPTNATPGSISNLVENVAKINRVKFGSTSGNLQTITATTYQVLPTTGGGDYTGTWAYDAMFDATALITSWINAGQVTASGAATYTFGHVVASNTEDTAYSKTFSGGGSTGYPLASPSGQPGSSSRYNYTYGSWSIVLIYSSPQTAGHQLWLYDIMNPNFKFSEAWASGERDNPDFDGDGVDGGIISGFLVPQGIEAEANSSKITVFVGEGDSSITGDSFQVNSVKLNNSVSTNVDNVWDWKSQPLPSSGGDIDTFYVNYPVIHAGDTSAQINLPTGSDGFTLIFIIISFRSDAITGGAITYLIR